MKKTKFKNYYLILLLILFFVSISCNSVIVRFPILNDVKLIELHVCEEEITHDSSAEEKERHCDNTYSTDMEEVYLCGDVSGIGDVDASLGIYLHKDGVERLIFHNTIDDRFTNGFFCRAIPLPNQDSREGFYLIEFRYGRNILDSIKFEISD